MTSVYIDFYFIYFLSKAQLYYIYNTTGLHEKMLYLTYNICDFESVFLFTDMYAIQDVNLSVNILFVKA